MVVSIGRKLRELRMEKNYSQADVASMLNLSRQTLSKWELDKSLPDLTTLKELALIYEVSLDALLEIPKERIHMLPTYNSQAFAEALAHQLVKDASASPHQIAFTYDYIVEPLTSALGESQFLWFTTEKQLILPGRYSTLNGAAEKQVSKDFLALTSYYSYRIIFLTTHTLGFFSAIDWLERGAYTAYPLTEMDFIASGKHYDPSFSQGNSRALGYKTKQGNFDSFPLEEHSAEQLDRILTTLDPEQNYTVWLRDISVSQFVKKHRRKPFR